MAVPLERIMGLLRLKVIRGVNLAIRDVSSSDPYIVVSLGDQKVRTGAKENTVNPEWDEDLTLYATDPNEPLKLKVYDSDVFFDDNMGDAEVDLRPFLDAVKMKSEPLDDDTVITTVIPGRGNCLIEDSYVVWKDRKVTQKLSLRLCNVECGEIQLLMQWIQVPSMQRTTSD